MAYLIGPPNVTEGGKEEKWDVAALIRYPSFQAFKDVTESEKYEKDTKMHRLAALEDWRLIATVQLTPEQAIA
jgi:phage terminase Nu1 subunit (DNA packaging protein)